ncbi:unnamed protein product [Peniophora sp. CBMAI 1063]|nr:unnamed protein product [Peniophora sp. CBMAI 1063]
MASWTESSDLRPPSALAPPLPSGPPMRECANAAGHFSLCSLVLCSLSAFARTTGLFRFRSNRLFSILYPSDTRAPPTKRFCRLLRTSCSSRPRLLPPTVPLTLLRFLTFAPAIGWSSVEAHTEGQTGLQADTALLPLSQAPPTPIIPTATAAAVVHDDSEQRLFKPYSSVLTTYSLGNHDQDSDPLTTALRRRKNARDVELDDRVCLYEAGGGLCRDPACTAVHLDPTRLAGGIKT